MIRRAQLACYNAGSVKDLPALWRKQAFHHDDRGYCLAPEYKSCVMFACQNLRKEMPSRLFDLILCRNLVFTYLDIDYQAEILERICDALVPQGVLVIGAHEALPPRARDCDAIPHVRACYRKREAVDCD
jgi:chemotaxis protein methyltransferase CheR